MPSERPANSLEALRAEKDLTHGTLADLIDTPRKSSNAIKMARMVPSRLLALTLARALNAQVERRRHEAARHDQH